MPDEIKYAPNATPPAFTNNADWTIEPGTHVRIKLIGTRTEVGRMFAVGNINGDYLGYACTPSTAAFARQGSQLTVSSGVCRILRSAPTGPTSFLTVEQTLGQRLPALRSPQLMKVALERRQLLPIYSQHDSGGAWTKSSNMAKAWTSLTWRPRVVLVPAIAHSANRLKARRRLDHMA
jgi:hypothetical protein